MIRGERIPPYTVTLEQFRGGNPADFITTSRVVLKLVSAKVIDLMERNHFTGWTTYPVQILNKRGEEVKGYFGLSITGSCRPLDQRLS